MESEEPTTSDIRSYAFRNNNSSVNTTAAHPNASDVVPDEDINPCSMASTTHSPGTCTSNTTEYAQNEQSTSEEGCTLFDFETQQLREMFPTCPENVLTAASERCATVDSAVDYVMNILGDQASMCSCVSTITLTSPSLIV